MTQQPLSFFVLFPLMTCVYVGGCGRSPADEEITIHSHFVIRHFQRTFTLTPAEPYDDKEGIRLLGVEPDGTAMVHVDDTDETLPAAPGGFFLGAYADCGPYRVRTFGEHGLQLESSDPDAQTAVFVQRWAE